ncbi:MAG: XdhC family protein, partial [Chloroflexi bacterium]|nr:XdhC family protein [Chloroflexota bacterium]
VEEGADPEAVAQVHTPIGLDIGAESPAEIAVSVMAEIILLRRGGHGRPLSEGRRQ